jgi:hypothetical protein
MRDLEKRLVNETNTFNNPSLRSKMYATACLRAQGDKDWLQKPMAWRYSPQGAMTATRSCA